MQGIQWCKLEPRGLHLYHNRTLFDHFLCLLIEPTFLNDLKLWKGGQCTPFRNHLQSQNQPTGWHQHFSRNFQKWPELTVFAFVIYQFKHSKQQQLHLGELKWRDSFYLDIYQARYQCYQYRNDHNVDWTHHQPCLFYRWQSKLYQFYPTNQFLFFRVDHHKLWDLESQSNFLVHILQ